MSTNLNETIFNQILEGGYILYFRHGETEETHESNVDLTKCETQRNLNASGRRQAGIIGGIFENKALPIDLPVLASPYCRTQETSKIAFGENNMQVNNDLGRIDCLEREVLTSEEQTIKNNLIKLFETLPSQGKNRIFIAHSAFGGIPYMGMVVIKPGSEGRKYEVVTKISYEEIRKWSNC
ncbi:histidine phosphatase family protein [Bacillus thuringiensis]|nr:histidine phosphatase family protein [Bacillus thuringiensis]MRB60557.1 histidine phosphatase family protein [Bacillus thuringiensis]